MADNIFPEEIVTALQAIIYQAGRVYPAPEQPPPADTLRASFRIEAVADHLVQCYRVTGRLPDSCPLLDQSYIMSGRGTPWVARLLGRTARGFRREFAEGVKDYTHANSVGSRGVYVFYALPPGLYEVNEPVRWRRNDRYFIQVADGRWKRITREEVERCLNTD